VIHTAAVSDTGLCQQKPEWSEQINVDGCVNLAQSCREFGAKLVICSSDQVYSGSSLPGPHREDELLTPNNVYGCQKLRAEQQCLDILPDTVCLRLSWMYSTVSFPGEHGQFLTTLKTVLADEAKPLTWPIHDRRGLTDVETVIKNLPAALKLPGGVWNFGAENSVSTYDTVKDLLTQLGMTAALARLQPNEAAFAHNPRDISMDLTKLNAAGIDFSATLEGLIRAMKKEEIL
jgi:dTDP-4-dehydrorhamnose reductase